MQLTKRQLGAVLAGLRLLQGIKTMDFSCIGVFAGASIGDPVAISGTANEQPRSKLRGIEHPSLNSFRGKPRGIEPGGINIQARPTGPAPIPVPGSALLLLTGVASRVASRRTFGKPRELYRVTTTE